VSHKRRETIRAGIAGTTLTHVPVSESVEGLDGKPAMEDVVFKETVENKESAANAD
jgi:hypothetical protein